MFEKKVCWNDMVCVRWLSLQTCSERLGVATASPKFVGGGSVCFWCLWASFESSHERRIFWELFCSAHLLPALVDEALASESLLSEAL